MTSQTAAAKSTLDELDDFFLDGDLDDNPFASPKGHKNDSSNKRKEPGDGLGIDEEVSIAKKARVPRIKLDQDRSADLALFHTYSVVTNFKTG